MDNSLLMKRVLRLAAKASGLTSPNPMVGAVLVKGGKIIAEDYHRKPGTPHAEALVIQKAREKSKGATLYVNLEPCCHTDKRTPPCTKAIINAGIKKVVIGMKDPNPKVAGKGIEELEKAGIKIISGILEKDAQKLNEAYIKYITTRTPFVTMKVAMTLDGKIATPEGESKWITGEKARALVHKTRSSVDAIITAIGTVKADDPQMTARGRGFILRSLVLRSVLRRVAATENGVEGSRGQGLETPKRIVIDPNLEIPMDARILQMPPETIIVAKRSAISSQQSAKILAEKGVKIIEYTNEKLDLKWLMEKLGKMEITSLLIEGGSSLNSHALEDGIVDKVMFFITPRIIGGKDSFPAVGGKVFRKLSEAHKLKDINVKRIGEDILIEGYIR